LRLKVELSRRARKELLGLPKNIAKQIINELRKLQDTPIPKYAVKIRGEKDVYRIRIGDYRILYKILWTEKTIIVFRITHRRKAYR